MRIVFIIMVCFFANKADAACILEGALCQKLTVKVLGCEQNDQLAAKIKSDNFFDSNNRSIIANQYRVKAEIINSSSIPCGDESTSNLGESATPGKIVNLTYNSNNDKFCVDLTKTVTLSVTKSCCDVLGSVQWCEDFEINSVSN